MAEQTILIAEDDPDIRDGVRILLSGEGYRILEAENGPRALSLLTPEVDLVILDIMMPKLSGLEVLQRLRAAGCRTPILLLTADIVGRLVVSSELPAGVVTAFLGAPLLIALTRRKGARGL